MTRQGSTRRVTGVAVTWRVGGVASATPCGLYIRVPLHDVLQPQPPVSQRDGSQHASTLPPRCVGIIADYVGGVWPVAEVRFRATRSGSSLACSPATHPAAMTRVCRAWRRGVDTCIASLLRDVSWLHRAIPQCRAWPHLTHHARRVGQTFASNATKVTHDIVQQLGALQLRGIMPSGPYMCCQVMRVSWVGHAEKANLSAPARTGCALVG